MNPSSTSPAMRAVLRLACSTLLFGCALTSKADVISPRYFSAEPSHAAPPERSAQAFELRLGQVSSASHLDERVAYRVGGSEMGFYEDRRWTEIPEAYLRRALERDLFEERGLSRIVAGEAPTLDVELTAFEELRGSPIRAHVTLTFSLRDERRSVIERTLDLEQPVASRSGADPAQSLAETLTATLAEAVREVGRDVVQKLGAAPAAGSAAAVK